MLSAQRDFPEPADRFDMMRADALPQASLARPGMFRAGKGKKVGGVCQALARELDYEPWVIRAAFAVGLFCGAAPLVVLAYAIGWTMIPYLPEGHSRFDPMPRWIAGPTTKLGELFESAAELVDRWI